MPTARSQTEDNITEKNNEKRKVNEKSDLWIASLALEPLQYFNSRL